MKKTMPALLIAVLCISLTNPCRAEEKMAASPGILTAIDVASSLRNSAAEPDIIKRLVDQKGVEKSSPAMKGMDNEQKILYLLSLPEAPEKKLDRGQTEVHLSAGDTFFKKGEFDKAATEYSLAAKFAPYDYAIYRARGNSYLGYLKANLSTVPAEGGDESGNPLFQQTRKLVCSAIYSDYRTTSRLIDGSISDGITEMQRLQARMKELKDETDPNLAYKVRAIDNINIRRELRRLMYRQATAKGAAGHLKEAMDEYRQACPAEESERAAKIRKERDKTRDAKWVQYGAIGEDTYFYDTSSVAKSKDGVTVLSRKENTEDVKSYDLNKVKLNCSAKTYTNLETSMYGQDGKLLLKREIPKTETRKAAPGSLEEALLGKACK